METIFDIFGSRDSVKPTTLNPLCQRLTTKGSEGVLPGKQIPKNEGPNLKGKKVLGDVGNKIKGLNIKSECNSSDSIKKPVQGVSSAPNLLQKIPLVSENVENTYQENPLTSHLIWEDCSDFDSLDKWPEVETQGPSFWSDDNYESVWPEEVQTSTIENFCQAANIWDFGTKCTIEHSLGPYSEEYDDNINFCLDLPSMQAAEIMLEEASVKFPWDM